MKNLFITEEIKFLVKEKISPNEIVFLKALLLLQEDNYEEDFAEYISLLKELNVDVSDIIKSLQEKGVILKSYHVKKKGEQFDPYTIPLNKIFVKRLYKCSFELGKELFEVYPQTININGVLFNGRSISDRFDSLEDAYFKYSKSIGWNPDKHQEIIELITWANDNNLIQTKMSKFIIDQGWMFLESVKNGDSANINFDAIKLV